MPKLDCDIERKDIQSLSNPDDITAFFTKLGYNTEARVVQSPENLGISAEGTIRPIKRIELIADQEGLFHIYLFELSSVTISHTRSLARSFRNRAGNYLLILTSDYEHIDFVLLERFLPVSKKMDATGKEQSGIRPHILTVERRKPSQVHLRVLRRFTYTESDPLYQNEKLISAYTIAYWSEEHFNNRALFSDYYLKERLRESDEWKEDPKPVYRILEGLYKDDKDASLKFAKMKKLELQKWLLQPVFDALGFCYVAVKKEEGNLQNPDYLLYDHGDMKKLLAVCLSYPWGRSLDSKDESRDRETPEDNPGASVVTLLEKGEAPWAIVTNGKIWRLYSRQTHSKATNYYEIDLDELLAQCRGTAIDPGEAFRYFWLLFRKEAFPPVEKRILGKSKEASFLDGLLVESEEYAKELGERLKERIFEKAFPHLAEGFISYMQQEDILKDGVLEDNLNVIFHGTLTLLYRILFLLYAEARDLLPVKETRGYYEISLAKLKREIAEIAGPISDDGPAHLKAHYKKDCYGLYDKLQRLFTFVDAGDPSINLPMYNGGLFLTNPNEDDKNLEARNALFLNRTKIGDRYLSLAIDLLTRDPDPKRHDLVFIDYKSLGVRHLGSIYEGLLEFKLRIAQGKMAILKQKGREIYEPYHSINERQKGTVDKQGKVIGKGDVYLENDKHERKATGSYYTPDHIVKYIVENAVGPVLKEKFESLRPELRKTQEKRNAFFKRQDALKKQGMRPEPEGKADRIGMELVDKIFDVKVLDPAMGSGHFLVEAVDFITDKAIDFLNGFPWNPVFAYLDEIRHNILQEMEEQGITIDERRLTDVNLLKRYILKRCIYGVDLNPMAVELAKVSLWLDCFTLGAPLSFLDHHIKCGNSLIGITVKEAQDAIEGMKQTIPLFGSSRFLKARRDFHDGKNIVVLFNLLEETVIRRTRPLIKAAYPEATIKGQKIHFPERRLKTIHYDLETTYQGIYEEVVSGIERLRLAPYNLENYKKKDIEIDKKEEGREQALVGIFKTLYLKRFESGIATFRISIHRALGFLKTFESFILEGRLINSADFHKAVSYLMKEDEEDDATPSSMADEIDANEDAKGFIAFLEKVDIAKYDLRRLHDALQADIEILSSIWEKIRDIDAEKDAKLLKLKQFIKGNLKGKKIIIFTYFKDTARYLYRHIGHPDNPEAVRFCIEELGGIRIRRMDSDADPHERTRLVQGFAPKANNKPEWKGTEKEIDILISTDVLSEGQNLQDCGFLINYDLHWNPTRMVQRAGRIDRLGSDFDVLWIYNMFPDEGLERLLRLVESLSRKIASIDQLGMLDASVLGETVHPRNFNTLRRIYDEDGSVIEEEEEFIDLASNEFMQQQLKEILSAGGKEMVESLPDGIHSGLIRRDFSGIFFYFQAIPKGRDNIVHFWKYYNIKEKKIIDNKYEIGSLIRCSKDTPRVVDPAMFGRVFEIQELIIEDILKSYQQKRALESTPKTIDPLQQTISTILQKNLSHPDIDRKDITQAIRFLNQPMLSVQIKELRKLYKEHQETNDIKGLVKEIALMQTVYTEGSPDEKQNASRDNPHLSLDREDIRLICFDFISGG